MIQYFYKNLVVIMVLVSASQAYSAIALHSSNPAVAKTETLTALGLPLENRISVLRSEGTSGYKNLVALMNDESASMEARWRAVTAMGRIGGKLSIPEMKQALHSKVWYLRNAALVSSVQIDHDQALAWAKELLSDKALVVRSAAVDVMTDLKDVRSKSILWQKLNAKENFRGKQSLWIRRKIVESLSLIEEKGSEQKFGALLADKDETLYPPAIRALERLTNQKLGNADEAPKFKRLQWQAWLKQNSTEI